MTFKVIQNTKINTQVFTFSSPETVTYPVAPLVWQNSTVRMTY